MIPVSIFVPSKPVVIINDIISGWCLNATFFLEVISMSIVWHFDNLEVIELGLIPIGQVPENTNVFKGEVVPVIVIGVVRNFILVNVLSSSEDTLHLDELSGVYLGWSVSFVSK